MPAGELRLVTRPETVELLEHIPKASLPVFLPPAFRQCKVAGGTDASERVWHHITRVGAATLLIG